MDVNLTVPEGYDIVLSCATRGSPVPIIMSYFDSVELTGNEDRTVISMSTLSKDSDGFDFLESSSILNDSGSFSCVTTNTFHGSTTYDMRIFNFTVYCNFIYTANFSHSEFIVYK